MNLSRIDRIEIEAAARQYVAGGMSKDKKTQFEIRMLQEPRIAQEVEITRRMTLGLRQLQRTGALDLVTPSRSALWPRVPLAAAAAIVIVLAATAVYYFNPAPSRTILATSVHELTGASGAPAPLSYVLAERRTSDDGLVIPKPNPSGVIQLNILPARPDAAGRYQVELRHATAAAGSEPLARIDTGSANQALVPVFLNTSELVAGRYLLTVIEPEILGRSPATTQYAFTLVPTEPRGPREPFRSDE